MSYYHQLVMHEALQRHLFENVEHHLVCNPVPEAAAAAPAALQYHNGPTIAHPKVVALYAGSFWADRAQNNGFLKAIVDDGYLSLGTPQGFGNGTFLGAFDIPAPRSNTLVDADCQAMIAAAIGRNGVPAADPSTIFVLLLPNGVSVAFTAGGQASCANFCAYHSNAAGFIYTVQPANTCQGCNQGDAFVGLCMTQSHEIAESCSDPTGQGWFNDSTGEENADEVAWVQEAYGGWTVQGYAGQDASGNWQNLVGAYAPVPSGPQAATVSINLQPNPVQAGKAAVVTVQVTGVNPTGAVQLLDGGKDAGSLPLDAHGAAAGTLLYPSPGTHPIQARYPGDAQNGPGDSSVVSLTVQQAPVWSPDPRVTAFLAWQVQAASWCKQSYAVARNATDALAVQQEEQVIEQVIAAYLPYVTGKSAALPRMALPQIPRK